MPVRNAEAEWRGDLTGGKGRMRLGGGAFEGAYSYSSRFEEGRGTNPEELIGAAHAGCFSMQFAGLLTRAGHAPERVHTRARVHIDKVGDGFRITRIELDCEVTVPGMDAAAAREQAEAAKKTCPVSQALGGVAISLDLKVNGAPG